MNIFGRKRTGSWVELFYSWRKHFVNIIGASVVEASFILLLFDQRIFLLLVINAALPPRSWILYLLLSMCVGGNMLLIAVLYQFTTLQLAMRGWVVSLLGRRRKPETQKQSQLWAIVFGVCMGRLWPSAGNVFGLNHVPIVVVCGNI